MNPANGIGYITVGTNNLHAAGKFYDELLGCIGMRRTLTDGRMLGWNHPENHVVFSVITPYDEEPASVGNGAMTALNVGTPENVEMVYKRALALNAIDEGYPHDRGSTMGFYGGYFRDLDGNKLVAYCLGYKPNPD